MPFLKRDKCMYHLNHDLISFCSCSECLLPVCEVCVRIHKNEHKTNQTQAKFQDLQDTIQSVHQEYLKQISKIEYLKQKISTIPDILVKNEAELTVIFKNKRENLIQIFQNLVLSLQRQFIEHINIQQTSYLLKLQSLQKQIQLEEQIKYSKIQNIKQLNSKNKLETVIQFYSNGQAQSFQTRYSLIQKEIQNIQNRQVQFKFSKIDTYIVFLQNKTHQIQAAFRTHY